MVHVVRCGARSSGGQSVKPIPARTREQPDALPLPAFEIDDEQRIVTMNEEAEFILRLDGRVNPRASTVIRSPGLLSAIENAIETGTVEPMTVEVESGPDETWRAHVSRPGRARRTLVVLEVRETGWEGECGWSGM